MLKQGCQAGIKIKLSEDKQSLIITDICEDHNHVVDKIFELNVIINPQLACVKVTVLILSVSSSTALFGSAGFVCYKNQTACSALHNFPKICRIGSLFQRTFKGVLSLKLAAI